MSGVDGFIQVAYAIRNQYILACLPTNANIDESFREIKVTESIHFWGVSVHRTKRAADE
jgi:hypothetical protein